MYFRCSFTCKSFPTTNSLLWQFHGIDETGQNVEITLASLDVADFNALPILSFTLQTTNEQTVSPCILQCFASILNIFLGSSEFNQNSKGGNEIFNICAMLPILSTQS